MAYFFGDSIGAAEAAKENAIRFAIQNAQANRAFNFNEQQRLDSLVGRNASIQQANAERAQQERALRRNALLGLARTLAQERAVKARNRTAADIAADRAAAEANRFSQELDLKNRTLEQRGRFLEQGQAAKQQASAKDFVRRLVGDRDIRDVVELDRALAGLPDIPPVYRKEAIRELAQRQRAAKELREAAERMAAELTSQVDPNATYGPRSFGELARTVLADPRLRSLISPDASGSRFVPAKGVTSDYPTDAIEYLRRSAPTLPVLEPPPIEEEPDDGFSLPPIVSEDDPFGLE